MELGDLGENSTVIGLHDPNIPVANVLHEAKGRDISFFIFQGPLAVIASSSACVSMASVATVAAPLNRTAALLSQTD